MTDLGYNYRITDFQCALGMSQLQKMPKFLYRRREIAARYDEALAKIPGIEPLGLRSDVLPASQNAERQAQSEGKEGAASDSKPCSMLHAPCSAHAYHLYVVRLEGNDRSKVCTGIREQGIGVNVHYIPIHLHPYYRKRFGTGPGLYPIAEKAYEENMSLPMFPGMTDDDVEEVIKALKKAVMQ